MLEFTWCEGARQKIVSGKQYRGDYIANSMVYVLKNLFGEPCQRHTNLPPILKQCVTLNELPNFVHLLTLLQTTYCFRPKCCPLYHPPTLMNNLKFTNFHISKMTKIPPPHQLGAQLNPSLQHNTQNSKPLPNPIIRTSPTSGARNKPALVAIPQISALVTNHVTITDDRLNGNKKEIHKQ